MTNASSPVILNVDDNEMCRYAITRILEFNNFRVTEACDGSEALRIASDVKPDLVLLDVNLPDINGFEVCRRLKADPVTARIPVLHITASYLSGSDKARGLESGAEHYLIEPVEPEVLIATINAILRARRAEAVAQKLAVEWQTTFDSISDGVAILDFEGRVQRGNASLERLLRKTSAELRGKLCYELHPSLAVVQPVFHDAVTSRRRCELDIQLAETWLHVAIDPIAGEEGTATGAVYILSDATERRQLEEQFRESQKFETIGTLAAGVAHDFNNLLTSIMGNASLSLSDKIPESVRDRLDEIVRASQRAADLTRQLLAYSGKGRHFVQRLDLSEVVRDMQKLIEAGVPKKIRLDLNLAQGLPRLEADLNQIQQLAMNLVTNAVEAIGEESGLIRIETGLEKLEEAVAPDGVRTFVYLEVRDTGCGMNAAVKSRMFDPFFTTKFTGRGLGLAAVSGIARAHNAIVQVASEPGQGSNFRIMFPALEQTSWITLPATRPAGTGTILIVDDEEMVRQIAKATLEIRGYKVLLAMNGLHGIEQVRAHPEISLVLLDLTMPVMSGEEALDGIQSASPGVKVVITTGYDSREAASRLSRKNVSGYLQKPYTARQLADRIKSVLDG